MKTLIQQVLCILVVVGTTVAGSGDKIAAIVGDSLILQSEVDYMVDMQVKQMGGGDALTKNILKGKVLDKMVEELVMVAHANQDTNIVIVPSEVNRRVDDRVAMIMAENKMTKEQLIMVLEKNEGMTFEAFRQKVYKQLHRDMVQQYVQQLYISQREPTIAELQKFVEEYKDSLPQAGESVRLQKLEVAIKPDSTIRQSAYDSIVKIRESIVDKNRSFQEMAKNFSVFNPENGGDLSFVSKGSFSEIKLENAIFALEPGEVSYPIETNLGFHLVTVTEKRDGKAHAYQIVLRVQPSQAKVTKVRDDINAFIADNPDSLSFSKKVTAMSTDEVTKVLGGDMGWSRIVELADEIKESFSGKKMASGILSTLSEDGTIFSLYRVANYVVSRPLSIESDREILVRYAQQRDVNNKLKFLIEKWKKEVFIQKF